MGALSTYRDHVVHLREGEKRFVPAFEEEKDGMEEAEILFLFQDPVLYEVG